MRFFRSLFTIVLLLICFQLEAQQCGLHSHEELISRLKNNKTFLKNNPAFSRNAVTFIPLKFHLISNDDGLGQINEKLVFDQLCSLNEFYAAHAPNIQFYIKGGFNYIENTNAFSSHNSSAGQVQFNIHKASGSLNIFIPLDANTNDDSQGVTLGYYDPNAGADWIVVRKADINGFSETLAHEVGHYLGLPHPFNGWDFEPYDNNTANPVGTYSPSTGFSSLIPNEKQDGSNCEDAGDYICDTPPDYNHFNASWECNYEGGAKDPNGILIDPDETNLMSYFNDCDAKNFSPDQVNLMYADLSQRISAGALQLGSQSFSDVAAEINLNFPLDGETTTAFNAIELSWEDVPGATTYFLEIDRFSSFNIVPTRIMVFGNSIIIEDLFDAGKTYYWRVRPFNPWDACTPFSETRSFTTGTTTTTKELDFVKNLQIRPNPIFSGQSLDITIESAQYFNADLNVYSITGQQTRISKQINLHSGKNQIHINLEQLSPGIYILSLQSTQGIMNKRLVVH